MINKEAIVQSLFLANPWWHGKGIPKSFKLPFKRPQLKKLISYEKLGRIIVIKGPRRTGKTTLMYQYIEKLLKKGVDPKFIFFVSMDDINLRRPIQELLDLYYSLVKVKSNKKTYLFIDEVQFLENWSAMIKVVTDRNSSIQVIVSGSSASLLIKSSESLAGRTIEEEVFPFNPKEIIQMELSKNLVLQSLLKRDPNFDLGELKFDLRFVKFKPIFVRYLNDYLEGGGFPHLIKLKDKRLWLELLQTDIIQKAIYKDLTDLYSIKEPLILEKLFLYLIKATSGILNLSSISIQLKISRETVMRYLAYLKNSYLLFSLPKYSNYPKEILKSQEKIHIIDPGLASLVGGVNKDKLLESLIATLLKRKRGSLLYYWRKNYEVDFVFETSNSLIPIEVKNSNREFYPGDYRGLINFMNKFKPDLKVAYVFYNGEAKNIKYQDFSIHFLPFWYAAFTI